MSEYNVKYRPQTITELDLVSVREGLIRLLGSGEIPHAFLFAGPRGTGKTSAARIVAKAVNCTGNVKKGVYPESRSAGRGEPCNTCDQCLSITAGNNLDVLEIDAASNRGIDDIRDLREKVKLVPSSATYKVYIIDEAHMLTPEAFNALLKTLEEPPKHVIFILCTTEPEKLPETIISRCLRFNFKRAKDEELLTKLEKIAKEESLEVTVGALKEIIKGASGSFRDALKILEQASFAGSKIDEGQVKDLLGQIVGLNPEKLFEFLAQKDTKGAIAQINRVVQMGGNLRIYTGQFLEMLRGVLLGKVGLDSEWKTVTTEAQKLTETLGIEEIKALIEIFSKASLELKEAIIPQLPLELAVVEWCGEENQKPESVEEETKIMEKKNESLSSPRQNKNVTLEEIQKRWPDILSGVKPKNFSIEAFLRACRPVDCDGKSLTIEVFYQFHKDKLESEKCRVIVEEVVNQIFGTPLALRCTLSQRPQKVKKEEPPKTKPGNGETTDEDIINVAEEIFNGKGSD